MINNRAIVGGGYRLGSGPSTSTFGNYYMYDPKTNSWSQINTFANGKRSISALFSINKKAYLVAGWDQSGIPNKNMWVYETPGISIDELNLYCDEFTCYPNPFSDQIFIGDILSQYSSISYSIYSKTGQLVLTGKFSNSSINDKGHYLYFGTS